MIQGKGIGFFLPAAVFLPALLFFTGCTKNEEPSETTTQETEQASAAADAETEDSASAPGQEIEEEGILLRWKVRGRDLELYLEAPTDGWLAVGFNPSNGMQDANFIIGYVKDGEMFLRDDFGTWFSSHDSDESLGGTDDVTPVSGSEEEGVTALAFSIPLDSGDEHDGAITLGEPTTVLLAYGAKDDYRGMHRKKTKVSVVFD